jgi:ATP-binding cassette, subfamily B, bacterial
VTAPANKDQAGFSSAGASDHEPDKRPLDRELIRRLFQATRPYALKRNLLFGLVLLRALQMPALGFTAAAIINGPISARDLPGTVEATLGFFLLALFTMVTMFFRMRLALELGECVVYDLRQQLFTHLQQMSMRFYDKTKLGRIISRFVSDLENVRLGVQDVFFISVVQLGQMLIAAALMFYTDAALFTVVFVLAPVLWLIDRYFRVRLSQVYRRIQESMSRITVTLAEAVNGMRVTQSFVRQEKNASLFRDLVEDHSRHHLQAGRLTGVFLPLLEFNNQFFLAVLLVLSGYFALLGGWMGELTPAQQGEKIAALVVFFFVVPYFFGPIATLGRMYNQALTSMAGAERVFRILDLEPEQLDLPGAVELPAIRGRVEFKKVSFAYDPGKPVLKQVSFTAEPGQLIALVGRTGSGKTTLANLICKFYLPTTGQLLIDNYDIREVETKSLARQLGVVLQQHFLFTGTVIDNIRMGRPQASDAQVMAAAEQLGCLDLLEALPKGFYTPVGESGSGLSLGQRQLVCFTRAMLTDPRILILDEATSAVDAVTEARIQQALSVLLKNRTSFVVAHRLSTIRHADKVLVLNHGQIIERGSHTQLLTMGGAYANLYRQFIRASAG